MKEGRFPRPVLVSSNVARWLADECEATLQRMIAARENPRKPPKYRDRPRGRSSKAAAEARATATDPTT